MARLVRSSSRRSAAEPVGRPAIRVGGPVLAGGGVDDDNPVAAAAGLGHQPR